MEDDVIRFPMNCRLCGKEWTTPRNRGEILDALDQGKPIRVYSACHDQGYDLSDAERESLAAIARSAV